MATVYDVVRQICLGLPETEEVLSHGFPTFNVTGRNFAVYSVNHHGDGRVALLLNISRDMQQSLVESAPKHFYVPPYRGTSGWVGANLNTGLSWDRISQLTCDAYCRVAPVSLARNTTPVRVKAPDEEMKPEDIDPYLAKKNRQLLERIRNICLKLPEVSETTQFGHPCFKAGKKTFCNLHFRDGELELQAWAGTDRQVALTSFDSRYRIPAYIGHNGWISLSLAARPDWTEVETLITDSYRHFALKRMLKVLPGDC